VPAIYPKVAIVENIQVLEEKSNSKHVLQRGLGKGDALPSLCCEEGRVEDQCK